MLELKALAREHRLRGYSQLRNAELIEHIRNDQWNTNPPLQSWEPSIPRRALNRPPRPPPAQTWKPQQEPQTEVSGPLVGHPSGRQPKLEAPLTKRQLKCRRNKDSKLAKKFKNLEKEIDNLKSQMDALKDKIMRASESTSAIFKRKKIRSMKREANEIAEKLRESEKALRAVEPRVPKDPISRAPLKLPRWDERASNLTFSNVSI